MKPLFKQICRNGPEGLQNLGFGGTLIMGVIAAVIAAYLGDSCVVILTYGPHAFFDDGLHVADWRHGILTNGEKLTFLSNLLRMLITLFSWAVIMIAAEFTAWWVRSFLHDNPR